MKLYLLLLLAFIPSATALVNLTYNETYVFSYPNAANESETLNESFYCSAFNQGLCVQNNVSVYVSLQPGESLSFSNSTCTAHAFCNVSSASNATQCAFTKVLKPGQTYSNVGGACNVSISVEDQSVNFTEQRVNYYIVKSGNNTRITIANKTIDLPNDIENYEYDGRVPFLCPRTPTIQTSDSAIGNLSTESIQDIITICKVYSPVISDAFSKTIDECQSAARTHVDDLKAAGDRERSLQQLNGDHEAKIVSLEAKTAEQEQQYVQLQSLNVKHENEKNLYFILSLVLGFALLISIGIHVWQIRQQMAGGTD